MGPVRRVSPTKWQVSGSRPRSGHSLVLFNDLVSAGEDRWWHRQPKRLGSLQVDQQLKSRRLLDWKVGRLGAFEDDPRQDATERQ